jgi:hypothetical protein
LEKTLIIYSRGGNLPPAQATETETGGGETMPEGFPIEGMRSAGRTLAAEFKRRLTDEVLNRGHGMRRSFVVQLQSGRQIAAPTDYRCPAGGGVFCFVGMLRAAREYNKQAGSCLLLPRRKIGDSMYFSFRPCPRRARWRKKHISSAAARVLAALGCLALVTALLFIAPQWVLVVIILALAALVVCVSRE